MYSVLKLHSLLSPNIQGYYERYLSSRSLYLAKLDPLLIMLSLDFQPSWTQKTNLSIFS